MKSKLTIVRLLASGALLGVTIAGLLGFDLSSAGLSTGLISSALGVGGSAILLKAVHVI